MRWSTSPIIEKYKMLSINFFECGSLCPNWTSDYTHWASSKLPATPKQGTWGRMNEQPTHPLQCYLDKCNFILNYANGLCATNFQFTSVCPGKLSLPLVKKKCMDLTSITWITWILNSHSKRWINEHHKMRIYYEAYKTNKKKDYLSKGMDSNTVIIKSQVIRILVPLC